MEGTLSFRIGDEVELNPESRWAGRRSADKPMKSMGVVYYIRPHPRDENELCIGVQWKGVGINNYSPKDLLPWSGSNKEEALPLEDVPSEVDTSGFHKHYEAMIAFAEGRKLRWKDSEEDEWDVWTSKGTPAFYEDFLYEPLPEPSQKDKDVSALEIAIHDLQESLVELLAKEDY